MPSYASQLQEEQKAVDSAYGRLDQLRAQVRQRLDSVRATGSHGSPTQRSERDSFAVMYEDRLIQLRAVEDRLVFGRLDAANGGRHYIGRIGLSSDNHEPILTDWRAEAARPFYEATPSNHGDIVMRRHITLSFRNVIGVEDEILDMDSDSVEQASTAGTLTGEGALLASLNSKRTGKMTDIVATIQGEQDRIIRADLNRAMVVQGGPGTGKTAVALHRAAYLLYTHRRTLERSGVLVVGPSSSFLHYIDQVLPSLGETGVVSRTIGTLIPGAEASARDTPLAAKLKGQRRMVEAIANAVAQRERVHTDLPVVKVNGISVPMLVVDVMQAITDAKRTHQPHNQARETFISSMMDAMKRRYIDQLEYVPEFDEIHQAMLTLRMDNNVRKALNLCWLPMTGQWLLDQLFSKPEQLRAAAPWLSDDEVAALIRPKGSPLTVSDIPLLDEAMELLGPDPKTVARQAAEEAKRASEEQYALDSIELSGLGGGIVSGRMLLDQMNNDDAGLTAQRAAADREWTYGHIVVDEAQELTEMDWRMLMRRCPSRSFTIVGDVAQTSALGGTRHWDHTMNRLFGEDNWSLNELTINYRNPQEVSALASRFAESEGLYISTVNAVRAMPDSVARVTVVDEQALLEQTAQQVAELASRFVASDGSGRVAVIAPDALCEDLRDAVDKQLRDTLDDAEYQRLSEQPAWDEQICVCGTQEVKGLEFDAVVVAEPGRIENDAPSRLSAAADLYVAMTRPTQRLVIVRTKADEIALEI